MKTLKSLFAMIIITIAVAMGILALGCMFLFVVAFTIGLPIMVIVCAVKGMFVSAAIIGVLWLLGLMIIFGGD